tara:strand:+ start:367 stop:588 length:222 start_codon:yes stop_codon:yes gene_type:complete
MENGNVKLDDIKKLMLASVSPILYPHLLGVFAVAENRLVRGEPILTEAETEKADNILRELVGEDDDESLEEEG